MIFFIPLYFKIFFSTTSLVSSPPSSSSVSNHRRRKSSRWKTYRRESPSSVKPTTSSHISWEWPRGKHPWGKSWSKVWRKSRRKLTKARWREKSFHTRERGCPEIPWNIGGQSKHGWHRATWTRHWRSPTPSSPTSTTPSFSRPVCTRLNFILLGDLILRNPFLLLILAHHLLLLQPHFSHHSLSLLNSCIFTQSLLLYDFGIRTSGPSSSP